MQNTTAQPNPATATDPSDDAFHQAMDQATPDQLRTFVTALKDKAPAKTDGQQD